MAHADLQPRSAAKAPFRDAAATLNTRTGAGGTLAGWVDAFAFVWAAPASRLDPLLDLLGPGVRLVVPGAPASLGRAEARLAFERTLAALPDLTAAVGTWAAVERGEADAAKAFSGVVYLDLVFSATIGGRRVSWPDVDRFVFQDGVAVERVAYFDPTPARLAFFRTPSGIAQYLRLRLRR